MWSDLNMTQRSELMELYLKNGITSLSAMKEHYNSFATGGIVNNPPVDPVLKGRQPKANFYQRLLNPFRQTMPDWENRINNQNNVATHKMSWATDDDGTAIVYPEVQEINDKLYDFTDPRNKENRRAALDRAIQTGDTIQMTPEQANFWTQRYKEFYPFNYADGGSLGKVTPYGQWQYPHQVTTIPSNNITMKGVNYPVVGVSNTGDTKVMLPNKNYEFDGEYVTEYPIHNFQKGGKLTRVRRNDSPTQASSESMEDRTAQHIQRFNADKIDHSYDIPYIPEKEIVVPGVGRVSTNALDSIAKYSYLAGIPLEEGLGLAAQESAFGAMPFLNYNKIPDSLPQEEKDRRAAANKALGNTSYFRNYGSIPANYLVRDWHYFDLTDEQREATPPLLDAFRYWKAGKYNTNDKSHTEDVRTKGRQVIKTTPIRAWMQSSKYVKKATTKKKK